METKNIKELERLEKNRNDSTGYLFNKDLRFNYDKLQYVTLVGPFDNFQFDPFIRKAIKEKEEELLKRALEIEEEYYQKIKRLAQLEAVNILADKNLLQ